MRVRFNELDEYMCFRLALIRQQENRIATRTNNLNEEGMGLERSGAAGSGTARLSRRGSEEKTIKDAYSPDHLQ